MNRTNNDDEHDDAWEHSRIRIISDLLERLPTGMSVQVDDTLQT